MTKNQFNAKVDAFFVRWDNQVLDYDKVYGGQCVDVIKQFFADVLLIDTKPRGNAVDYWANCPELEKIANTPSGVPQLGDIIIWGTGIGQYGHIALVKSATTTSFQSFDQNYPLGSKCHFVTHNYKNILGWLRGKNINDPEVVTPPTPQVDPRDAKIVDLTNQLAACQNKPVEVREVIKEVIKEVPVDKIVEKEVRVEVPVEIIKEKVIEIPVTVYRDKELTDEDRRQITVDYIKAIFSKIFKK